MYRKISTLILLAFFTVCFASFSFAASTKIGVIDIKEVVNNCKYGQSIMQQLNKKYEELKTKLQQEVKKLEELKQEIQNKSALWSKEVKEKKQEEYQKLLQEVRQLQQESEVEMQAYQQKLLQPLFNKLEKVISDYAKDNDYDLIIEKKQPGIYYASPKIDITNKIIKILDNMYEENKNLNE